MEGQDPGWSQDKDQVGELVGQASQEAPGWSQDKDHLSELVGQASQDPGWSQDKDQLIELVGQASQEASGWSQDKDQLSELVGHASQEVPGLSQDKDQLTELVGQASQDPGWSQDKDQLAEQLVGTTSQNLLIEQLTDPCEKEKEEMAKTGQEADKPVGQLEPEKERAKKRKAAEEDEWDALLASQEEGLENIDMEQSPVNEETRGADQIDIQV